jgi:hypothetical protein
MTVLPDSADLAANRETAAHGRRRGLSAGFWAAMIFAAVCLFAAATVAIVFGVFSRQAHPATRTVARSNAANTETPSSAMPGLVARQPLPPTSGELPPTVQLAALDSRVRRLEDGEARTMTAAAAALAAATLSDSAAGSHPFTDALAAVERLMPGSPHVQALTLLATQGAPTRAALASELDEIAARAVVAARMPAKDAGFVAQLSYAFSRVVSIRRIDTAGAGPDAMIARAQKRAAEGDIEGALGVLSTLPEPGRGELADWRERAQRRVEIDSHIAALRAMAMANLAAVSGSGS